jgi:hypothetical protein
MTKVRPHKKKPHTENTDADGYPWVRNRVPNGFWTYGPNRVRATKWLFEEKLKQDPRDVSDAASQLHKYLRGMMRYYSSAYKAIKDAYAFEPLDLQRVPVDYWKDKKNRIDATRDMVDYLESKGRSVKNIGDKDFLAYGIHALLKYTNGSSIKALREAGYRKKPRN